MGTNKVLLFLLLPLSLSGQANRYFVSFKDKANSIYNTSVPLQFLSQKSIDRRAKENFVTTEEDFPVNASYVQQVKSTGASVYFSSRWMNGVLVQTTPAIAQTISQLQPVYKIELVAPDQKLTGGRIKSAKKNEGLNATIAVQNLEQLKMIGLDRMHAEGYHGEGISIAIFDGGFTGINTQTAFQTIYQDGRLKDAFDFVKNSVDVYNDTAHGTWVMSIMGGSITGSYDGGVSKANYFLYKTEDVNSEYRIEEYNWLFAAERADSAGVDVINSSLGYNQFDDSNMDYAYADMNGKTTVISRAARKAVERGIVVVNSAGNDGDDLWKYISAPADALGVISVGATDSLGARAAFSSLGPSSDGRIKPDVAAMGVSSVVVDIDGTVNTGDGTSFSSPLVACLAAGLRQEFPNASAAEIYSRVVNSASQANRPDDFLGFGVPDFLLAEGLIGFNSDFEIYPNPVMNSLKIIFKDPAGQNFAVTIWNSNGQKVLENSGVISWSDDPYVIDVSGLANGLFLLRVQTSAGIRNVRIVKANY